MISIFLSYQSKKREVIAFLDGLHKLLRRNDFDINTDLTLISKPKQGNEQKFSTPYTLLDLDYDTEDVVDRLKELKVEEYSETKIDKKSSDRQKLQNKDYGRSSVIQRRGNRSYTSELWLKHFFLCGRNRRRRLFSN